MQIPDEVRKCVVFLAYRNKDGAIKFAGTGFFVSMPIKDPVSKDATEFLYLVTAKHVIAQIRMKSADQLVLIRINDRSGGFQFGTCALDAWVSHPSDPYVDVSVLPWAPDHKKFDYMSFPFDSFLTAQIADEQGVGIGDEVFMVGLFASHYGKQRNVPVVRIGNIACVPEEPVDTQMGPAEAYIIEARSIGGLSGSPVMVILGGMRPSKAGMVVGGALQLRLLGLVHGHWDVKEGSSDALVLDDLAAREARVNMGMAIIVPFGKLAEVLEQGQLESARQDQLLALAARSKSSDIGSATES